MQAAGHPIESIEAAEMPVMPPFALESSRVARLLPSPVFHREQLAFERSRPPEKCAVLLRREIVYFVLLS